jgi:Ras GTPase-activating protein 3
MRFDFLSLCLVFPSPFYGEEFEFEVPRRFRWLAVYVRDGVGPGTSRVIGKAALRRQQLLQVHGKDHWFPLKPVDADSEVQVSDKQSCHKMKF